MAPPRSHTFFPATQSSSTFNSPPLLLSHSNSLLLPVTLFFHFHFLSLLTYFSPLDSFMHCVLHWHFFLCCKGTFFSYPLFFFFALFILCGNENFSFSWGFLGSKLDFCKDGYCLFLPLLWIFIWGSVLRFLSMCFEIEDWICILLV